MASGTIRNGVGSQSPGANLTSNEDAHEHAIDINLQEEPIKQEETWKWNPISPITWIFSNAWKRISLSRASGSSRNGVGSQSPGANLTSNEDAHEHVIDINLQEEPMNQQETQNLNPISAITCIFSSRASGSSADVTSAVEMNRVSLPPRPLLNNQNSPISSFQDLQQEALLDITNQQKLPDSVLAYLTASGQLQDATRGLKEIIKAFLKGWTSTNCRYTLAASTAALEEVVNKVNAEQQNQLDMWKKQQSDGESLDAELRGIILCKDNYNTIFTYLAALFGGCIFIALKIHPVSVAVIVGVLAAGASYVSIAVKNWLDSYHDELKIPVEKRKEITKAISGACMLALEDLRYIEELASTLKSHTKSMLKMVDSGAMESNVIMTEIEALKQGFQRLETKLDRCSKKADSRSDAVVINILNKLD